MSNLKELIFQYALMKKIVADITVPQLSKIEEALKLNSTYDQFISELNIILKNKIIKTRIVDLFELFKNDVETLKITKLALKYIRLKEHILYEKNLQNSFEIVEKIIEAKFEAIGIHGPSYKLTLTYDNYSRMAPYSDRAFAVAILNRDSKRYTNIDRDDVRHNVFQIILDESIMQSGRSNSGGDYERRIAELFKYYNLDFISHHHEENNRAQEHDLVITYKSKKIGVGAKRTLRERYKQYNPTEVDFSVVFTIGEDLNEAKATTITEAYTSCIFVADEIYEQFDYLVNNPKIFRVTDFSPNTLSSIIGIIL